MIQSGKKYLVRKRGKKQLVETGRFQTIEEALSTIPYIQQTRLTRPAHSENNYRRRKTINNEDFWCIYCYDDPAIDICCFCGCKVCFGKFDSAEFASCHKCTRETHRYCLPAADEGSLIDTYLYCETCIRANAAMPAPKLLENEGSLFSKDSFPTTSRSLNLLAAEDMSITSSFTSELGNSNSYKYTSSSLSSLLAGTSYGNSKSTTGLSLSGGLGSSSLTRLPDSPSSTSGVTASSGLATNLSGSSILGNSSTGHGFISSIFNKSNLSSSTSIGALSAGYSNLNTLGLSTSSIIGSGHSGSSLLGSSSLLLNTSTGLSSMTSTLGSSTLNSYLNNTVGSLLSGNNFSSSSQAAHSSSGAANNSTGANSSGKFFNVDADDIAQDDDMHLEEEPEEELMDLELCSLQGVYSIIGLISEKKLTPDDLDAFEALRIWGPIHDLEAVMKALSVQRDTLLHKLSILSPEIALEFRKKCGLLEILPPTKSNYSSVSSSNYSLLPDNEHLLEGKSTANSSNTGLHTNSSATHGTSSLSSAHQYENGLGGMTGGGTVGGLATSSTLSGYPSLSLSSMLSNSSSTLSQNT